MNRLAHDTFDVVVEPGARTQRQMRARVTFGTVGMQFFELNKHDKVGARAAHLASALAPALARGSGRPTPRRGRHTRRRSRLRGDNQWRRRRQVSLAPSRTILFVSLLRFTKHLERGKRQASAQRTEQKPSVHVVLSIAEDVVGAPSVVVLYP